MAQICRPISSEIRQLPTIGKEVLNSNTSSTCSHNMVNFGSLAAEICWRVWGTPANFNGFRVLTALLHGTLVVAVSQTLQGGHHIRHWPTLVFLSSSFFFSSPTLSGHRSDVCHTSTRCAAPVRIYNAGLKFSAHFYCGHSATRLDASRCHLIWR